MFNSNQNKNNYTTNLASASIVFHASKHLRRVGLKK